MMDVRGQCLLTSVSLVVKGVGSRVFSARGRLWCLDGHLLGPHRNLDAPSSAWAILREPGITPPCSSVDNVGRPNTTGQLGSVKPGPRPLNTW